LPRTEKGGRERLSTILLKKNNQNKQQINIIENKKRRNINIYLLQNGRCPHATLKSE